MLAASPARWAEAGAAGAARFLGLPHEGEHELRRLVRLIGIDLGAGPLVYPGRAAGATAAVAAVLAGK